MQPHERLCAFVPANSGSVLLCCYQCLTLGKAGDCSSRFGVHRGRGPHVGLFPARASEDRATCAGPLGAIWVAPTQVHDATAAQSSGERSRVSMALCPQVAEIYRCDADVMQRRSMRYAVGGRGGIVDNTVALASPLAF